MQHSPAPTFILADGKIRYANAAAFAIFHYDRESIEDVSFVDLLDEGSRTKGQVMLDSAQPDHSTPYELNQIAGNQDILTIGYRAILLHGADHGEGTLLLLGEVMTPVMTTTSRLLELNQRLNALFALASSTTRSLVMDELVERALDVAVGELNLRAAAVFLRQDVGESTTHRDGGDVRLVSQQGFTPAFEAKIVQTPHVLPFNDPTFRGDEAWTREGTIDELALSPADLRVAVGPLLSLAIVPLRSDQEVLGWLFVLADRYRAFVGAALETLATIGNLLGPPLENTRLYAALLERSGQIQAILDGIDSGVLLVDRHNVVRYANQRLGLLLDEDVATWPGQPRDAVFRSRLLPIEHHDDLFGSDLWTIQQPVRRILRRYRDEVAAPDGALIGRIEVYADVTEAEEMNQLKEDFIASAAHDLKTPVTAVKGYAQMALRQARRNGQDRLADYLEMINTRSDELSFLMDSLLDVSRIQAGRLQLFCESFDIARIIKTVEQHFDYDLQRRRRYLQVSMPHDDLMVYWDRLRIERVLINVVGNAMKYAPEGTPIEIDVRHDSSSPDAVELIVTDHGVGIVPEERDRVFERFYRTPQSLSDGIKGSGLGLYFCRRIVEEHEGRIWISDPINGASGTSVHVVLPQTFDCDAVNAGR